MNFSPRFLLSWALLCSTAIGQDAVDIGSRRELFVDRLLIERMVNAELRMHHPIKTVRAKSPLPVAHYITILKDRDEKGVLYRAYWRGHDPSFKGEKHTGHAGETVEYGESRDGHEWTFPILKLHAINGTQDNNVLLANMPPLLTNFSPFIDLRANVPRDQKYKAICGYPGPGDKRGTSVAGRGLFAFCSADGIHWRKQSEVIPYRPSWRHAFDSQNVAFWSDTEQQYVAYFRTWTSPERLRSISRTTSTDFKNWTAPVEMNPNLPGEHLYTNQTHPYFRAPHIYIALPTRYVRGRGNAPNSDAADMNATDILLMSSRAGSEHYDRTFKDAFIRPGLDPKRWSNRSNYAALNVVPTADAEMSIYHRSGDRYVLRTDGFASIHTTATQGEIVTRPIVFSGSQLELNFSSSAAGSLRVEFQNIDGSPLPGLTLADFPPIYGDDISYQVQLKTPAALKKIAGQPVRLRFVMTECDLFSFRFCE